MPTSCSRRQTFRLLLALALAFSLAAGSWPGPQRAAGARAPDKADAIVEAHAKTSAETEQRAREAYGKLGVSFEENRGQADARVRFLSRRGGATVFLTNDEASFILSAPGPPDRAAGESSAPETLARRGRVPERRGRPKSHAVRLKFEGANPRAEVVGERELEGKVNYFRGNDPSKWQTNVKTYGAVRYRGLYDGVDLVYYGNSRGQMEYDFEVAPGASADQISLKIEGAKAVEVDASGQLIIGTPAGEMRQRRPTVYQEVGGTRREVASGYAVEAGGRVRFKLGEYDKRAPLIIDPALEYSTYLGGSDMEVPIDIAVDSAGSAYVTGFTISPDFPVADAVQNFGGVEAFVTKLSADGSALVYSAFLGSNGVTSGSGIAVDSNGSAYVAGVVSSTGFPVVNAIQSAYGGGGDAFITKLNAAGSALVYSTYLGSSDSDSAFGIAVDPSGSACIAGMTYSTDFPVVNPVQANNHGSGRDESIDGFVAKLTTAGSALVYSTYLGGSAYDEVSDIAVDSAGNAYVAGLTYSADFPVANALQGTHASPPYSDAFVAKLNAAGSALVYSTFLGGGGGDEARGIAVDPSGNAYVTGRTSSTDFPVVNALQGVHESDEHDAFVTKLNAAGSALVYSTYLGGSDYDEAHDIALDPSGSAYVAGETYSNDFPVVDPVQKSTHVPSPSGDAFVSKLNAAGTALYDSTYFGGSLNDLCYGIAVDSNGNAYVTGHTRSEDFPVVNPIQGTYGGGYYDAFVTKLNFFRIRGRVVIKGAAGAVGVPWVTVKLTGSLTRTELTDAHGYYSFTGLKRGDDYTVTPTKNNLSFAPTSRTFNNLYSPVSDVNFTVPSLSVGNVAVTEGGTHDVKAIFTVKLNPASAETVTVNYQTIDGPTNTATALKDYRPQSSQLTFAPGETTKAVFVTVTADYLDEGDETFRLRLSAAAGALATDNIGVCTIRDNNSTPTLSVNDVAVTEGDAAVTATFTVTLSAASGRTVKVQYQTLNGTATAPADYTGVGLTTLTFTPGETTKTVSVTVAGDTLDESTESFKLRLSSPTNATVADGIGVCTITDDD